MPSNDVHSEELDKIMPEVGTFGGYFGIVQYRELRKNIAGFVANAVREARIDELNKLHNQNELKVKAPSPDYFIPICYVNDRIQSLNEGEKTND